MELFTLYDKFLELRSELIAYAVSNSVYSEDRDGEKVRPLSVIRDDSQLRKVNKMIALWHSLADQLCEGDPARYNRKSIIFSPEPRILHKQADVFIKVNKATSTRKISKDRIILRLRDLRRVTKQSGGVSDKVIALEEEIQRFKDDPENTYRIRTEGYTEVVLLHRQKGDIELDKVRVPFAGVFIYDPKNLCAIHMPDSGRDFVRSDRVEDLGVPIIQCSLQTRGFLFRETDLINARAKTAEDRRAAIEEKDRKAQEAKDAEALKVKQREERVAKAQKEKIIAANKMQQAITDREIKFKDSEAKRKLAEQQAAKDVAKKLKAEANKLEAEKRALERQKILLKKQSEIALAKVKPKKKAPRTKPKE